MSFYRFPNKCRKCTFYFICIFFKVAFLLHILHVLPPLIIDPVPHSITTQRASISSSSRCSFIAQGEWSDQKELQVALPLTPPPHLLNNDLMDQHITSWMFIAAGGCLGPRSDTMVSAPQAATAFPHSAGYLVACLHPSVSSATIGQHFRSRCLDTMFTDCLIVILAFACSEARTDWRTKACFFSKKGLRMDLRKASITKWSRRVPWSRLQLCFFYQDFHQEVWLLLIPFVA